MQRQLLGGFKGGLLATLLFIAACGGGGGDSQPSAAAALAPNASANAAPTLQGQPSATVLVGQAYSFQPFAADANGDALTYSAPNLPGWLTLNPTTGRLSGTPTAADVATYAITLIASDGTNTTSLGPFQIVVTSAGSGTAALTWTPPTLNLDGTSLLNLTGYQVLYGSSADTLSNVITIDNPSLSAYVVENLPPGTWYFAVVAVNAIGAGSPLSNVASKTIS